MSHACPKEGCPRQVRDDLLACGEHWRLVSPATRALVWAAYDGRRGLGTPQHTEAVAAAISEMNQ